MRFTFQDGHFLSALWWCGFESLLLYESLTKPSPTPPHPYEVHVLGSSGLLGFRLLIRLWQSASASYDLGNLGLETLVSKVTGSASPKTQGPWQSIRRNLTFAGLSC